VDDALTAITQSFAPDQDDNEQFQIAAYERVEILTAFIGVADATKGHARLLETPKQFRRRLDKERRG
jgi:hypothetical protein